MFSLTRTSPGVCLSLSSGRGLKCSWSTAGVFCTFSIHGIPLETKDLEKVTVLRGYLRTTVNAVARTLSFMFEFILVESASS